jgi:hypothetical protein
MISFLRARFTGLLGPLAAGGLVALAAVAAWWATAAPGIGRAEEVIVLLMPDDAARTAPVTTAWLDAAREEGVRVVAMTDDEWLRAGLAAGGVAGVVLPDTVHPRASDLLVASLTRYVRGGGKLLLAFDAGSLMPGSDAYSVPRSRFSQLAGVDYALYGEMGAVTIGSGPVHATAAAGRRLGIEPGKLDFLHHGTRADGELATYGYERLRHGYYRTGRNVRAQVLMHSNEGDAVIAEHTVGKGRVLFANLALGYLKTRTDGYLLHCVLQHFAIEMAQQVHLAPVPGGVGGMVLNLHIDSNAAQAPLLALEAAGWFARGPFSLHATAGPDTFAPGDHLGLDVANNPQMQAFFRRMVARGHEIGDHGGWAHDIFGRNANATNRAEYEPYLDRNDEAMSAAGGRRVVAYSAPEGNQPAWATEWLARRGFKAYYFAGDAGLGPTRPYSGGVRAANALWAFPVAHFMSIATFEELDKPDAPGDAGEMVQFLADLMRYTADRGAVRLFYLHPPAVMQQRGLIETAFATADALERAGTFRWYTMERMADFMSLREAARWRIDGAAGGERTLVASSTAGLRELTWIVPGDAASRPEVRRGVAQVTRGATGWRITAGECDALVVAIRSQGALDG